MRVRLEENQRSNTFKACFLRRITRNTEARSFFLGGGGRGLLLTGSFVRLRRVSGGLTQWTGVRNMILSIRSIRIPKAPIREAVAELGNTGTEQTGSLYIPLTQLQRKQSKLEKQHSRTHYLYWEIHPVVVCFTCWVLVRVAPKTPTTRTAVRSLKQREQFTVFATLCLDRWFISPRSKTCVLSNIRE